MINKNYYIYIVLIIILIFPFKSKAQDIGPNFDPNSITADIAQGGNLKIGFGLSALRKRDREMRQNLRDRYIALQKKGIVTIYDVETDPQIAPIEDN